MTILWALVFFAIGLLLMIFIGFQLLVTIRVSLPIIHLLDRHHVTYDKKFHNTAIAPIFSSAAAISAATLGVCLLSASYPYYLLGLAVGLILVLKNSSFSPQNVFEFVERFEKYINNGEELPQEVYDDIDNRLSKKKGVKK